MKARSYQINGRRLEYNDYNKTSTEESKIGLCA